MHFIWFNDVLFTIILSAVLSISKQNVSNKFEGNKRITDINDISSLWPEVIECQQPISKKLRHVSILLFF